MQLNALILCGGKSSRMNEDKSLINYHGIAQKDYLKDLLMPFCQNVYFSYKEQLTGEDIINDAFDINGPTSGIMSAFNKNSNSAWLVVACDLPFVDQKTIEKIVKKRNQDKDATAFKSENNKIVEPLCAIYEPRIIDNFKKYIGLNKTCPRKVLLNSDVELIELDNKNALNNANTQEDKDHAISVLKGAHDAN